MLSNNYQKHIELLRSREEQPPFEEIRKLVLYEKPRKILALPFWLFASASIPLLVLLSLLLYPELFGLQRIAVNNTAAHLTRPFQETESIPKNQSSLAIHSVPHIKVHRFPIISKPSLNIEQGSSIARSDNQNIPKHNIAAIDKATETPSPIKEKIKTDELPAAPVRNADSDIANYSDNNHHFNLFISGGCTAAKSSIAFTDILYGAIGARYSLNAASSLIFELRKNVFIRKYTTQKMSFRDTLLTVGNQTYQNTIGQFISVPSESAANIFSLDAGYRYAFMESAKLTPFAQVLLGANTHGGITSEAAGIQYTLNSLISTEFLLRADQLFTANSSPQTAININASVSFAW
jgi:hypothetical protein